MKMLIYEANTKKQKIIDVPDEIISEIPADLAPTLEERIERLEEIVSP